MNHKQAIYRLILQKIILTSWIYSKKVGLSNGVNLGQNYQFLPTNYRQSVWETCLNTISIFAILFGEASTADIFFFIFHIFCDSSVLSKKCMKTFFFYSHLNTMTFLQCNDHSVFIPHLDNSLQYHSYCISLALYLYFPQWQ